MPKVVVVRFEELYPRMHAFEKASKENVHWDANSRRLDARDHYT